MDIIFEIPPEVPDITMEELSKGVFDELDTDENGGITKDEFIAIFVETEGKKYSNILVQKAQSIFLWLNIGILALVARIPFSWLEAVEINALKNYN